MTWEFPALLWLLAPLAALGLGYVRWLRRRLARGAVAFPLWLVADAAGRASRVRRYLPGGLFFAALVFLIAGVARPVVPWPTPNGIPFVLVIDVSRSMEENDVLPSRIEATKIAALDFVNGLPRATRVALVTFGSMTTLVVPLTDNRDRLRDAIRALQTQLRTQLGTGLVEGVRAVTGEAGPPASGVQPGFGAPPGSSVPPGSGAPRAQPDRPRAIAILLSDGRASDGVPPLEAAEEARRQGVRVHTVGVATTKDPTKLRSGYWGVLDDDTLKAIADVTGGRYYHAGAAGRLREIYRELARTGAWEPRPTEVTAIAGGVALLLFVAAAVFRYSVYPIH
ncbi:MAG: VWA domain-containing protein [Armatimonadota bacterium]|nr:VWA domain-containing protein [Armatimonadota bacterium]